MDASARGGAAGPRIHLQTKNSTACGATDKYAARETRYVSLYAPPARPRVGRDAGRAERPARQALARTSWIAPVSPDSSHSSTHETSESSRAASSTILALTTCTVQCVVQRTIQRPSRHSRAAGGALRMQVEAAREQDLR
jgi:hypothetical protein